MKIWCSYLYTRTRKDSSRIFHDENVPSMVHLHTFADLMAQQSHAAAECRVHDQLLRLEVVLLYGHDRQRGGPRQRDALHLLLRRDFSRKQRRDALTDQSLAHPRLPLRRGLNRAFLVVEIVRPFRGEEHLRAVVALLLSLSLSLGKVRKKEREEQRSGKSSFSLLFFVPPRFLVDRSDSCKKE